MAMWTLRTEKEIKKQRAAIEKRIEKIEHLLEHGTVSGSQDEKQLKSILQDCIEQLDRIAKS